MGLFPPFKMNYPAASSGVSKTTTAKILRPKGRGIYPDGIKNSYHPVTIKARENKKSPCGMGSSELEDFFRSEGIF